MKLAIYFMFPVLISFVLIMCEKESGNDSSVKKITYVKTYIH